MLTKLKCEVKEALECEPKTKEVCKDITFTETTQEIVPRCKDITMWKPFQKKWHLKKCLFPTKTSTLGVDVLDPLEEGESADNRDLRIIAKRSVNEEFDEYEMEYDPNDPDEDPLYESNDYFGSQQ